MRDGKRVRLDSSGRTGEVSRLLGEGGQGSVFEVVVPGPDGGGERLALKWYFPGSATDAQRRAIADLIERGRPSQRFLWPLELVSASDEPGFGYVMPLRPPQYVGLAALMGGGVEATLRTICTIGFQLADAYLLLHTQGLCYRDISFGNVFFDPLDGNTLICDNDNVGIEGRSPSAVMGTRRFMAPEIVRREANPNTSTDLYSLAVLLFYLLVVGHPLLGRRELLFPLWDEHAESELFGRTPLFVFDPTDPSNAPVPGQHDAVIANWELFPASTRVLFVKAFTAGLRDPLNGRVRESQWRSELAKLRDLITTCPSCGCTSFFDETCPIWSCWSCAAPLGPPMRLVIGTRVVVLNEGTEVTAHHLGTRPYDFATVVGRVERHPERADLWGLRNVSAESWAVALPEGGVKRVEPGRSIALVPGASVDFGGASGALRYG